jgi:AcrR family transcriptional regulator
VARKKNIDRDRILDAAHKVVLYSGAHALTLDKVAAEAHISKGGLTYTFATKEALLSAILDRDVTRFRSRLEAFGASHSGVTYPELRALLDVCQDVHGLTGRFVGPVLAALMHAPSSLKSTRAYFQWMLSKLLPDTAQDRRARLVFFALLGLVLIQGIGLLSLTATKRRAIVKDFINFLNAHRR